MPLDFPIDQGHVSIVYNVLAYTFRFHDFEQQVASIVIVTVHLQIFVRFNFRYIFTDVTNCSIKTFTSDKDP